MKGPHSPVFKRLLSDLFILWSRISDKLWHSNKYKAFPRQNFETPHALLSFGFLQTQAQFKQTRTRTVGCFIHYLSGRRLCRLFFASVTWPRQMMTYIHYKTPVGININHLVYLNKLIVQMTVPLPFQRIKYQLQSWGKKYIYSGLNQQQSPFPLV